MTDATSRAGTAYPSEAFPVFSGVRVSRSLVLCVRFVDGCLYLFFWPLCCLSFFDLRILITLPLCYLQTLLHEPIKAFLVYDPQTVRTDNNISAVVTEDTIETD